MWEIVAFLGIFGFAYFYFVKNNSGKTKESNSDVVTDLNIEEKQQEEEAKVEEVTEDTSTEKMLSEGNKRFEDGDLHGAEAIFIEVLKKDRKNQKAYLGLGNILLSENNYPDAIVALERAVYFKADDDMALNNLGLAYYKQRNYAKAAEYFQKAIEVDPDVHQRFVNLALAAKRNKDHKLAIKTLEQLISLGDKNNIDHLKFLASEYELIGYHEKALKTWTHALEIDPEDVEVKRQLAKY